MWRVLERSAPILQLDVRFVQSRKLGSSPGQITAIQIAGGDSYSVAAVQVKYLWECIRVCDGPITPSLS